MKKVTIKDVARDAEVSPSTVSRVLSNDSRISEETRQRVRKAVAELGYHPNAIARSLVTQQTKSIGLILSRPAEDAFANPFFPGIIQGITSVTEERGFNLLLSAARDYHQEHEAALNMLRNGKVDGVILTASRVNDGIIEQLLNNNYPFVLIGRSLELTGIPVVNNDNILAASRTVNYLLEQGARSIVLLSGPREYVVSRDRVAGYRQALQQRDIPYNSELVRYSNFTFEGGYRETVELLRDQRIDAVFALDDMIALGALRAAQDNGYSIPQDITLIGFNDSPLAAYLKPALTTVRIPIVRMGIRAAEMLIRIIGEEDYRGEEVIVPTEIIKRETTR